MKKTRNTFFAESNYQSYNSNMQGIPFQTSSNYYYQGPIPNYNTPNISNDTENRLAKIERQINRIEYRLSKLENTSNIINDNDFDNQNSNMYML